MLKMTPVAKALSSVVIAGTLLTGCSKSDTAQETKSSLEYLPQSSNVLIKADIAKIISLESVAKKIAENNDNAVVKAFAEAGFKLEDLKTVTAAIDAQSQSDKPEKAIFIVEMKNDVSIDKLIATLKAQKDAPSVEKQDINGKTAYKLTQKGSTEKPMHIMQVSSKKMALFSPEAKESFITVLEGKGKNITTNEKMMTFSGAKDRTDMVWIAATALPEAQKPQDPGVKELMIYANYNKMVTAGGKVLFNDEAKAQQTMGMLQFMVGMMRAQVGIDPADIKIQIDTTNKAQVSLDVKLTEETLKKIEEKASANKKQGV